MYRYPTYLGTPISYELLQGTAKFVHICIAYSGLLPLCSSPPGARRVRVRMTVIMAVIVSMIVFVTMIMTPASMSIPMGMSVMYGIIWVGLSTSGF